MNLIPLKPRSLLLSGITTAIGAAITNKVLVTSLPPVWSTYVAHWTLIGTFYVGIIMSTYAVITMVRQLIDKLHKSDHEDRDT